MERHQQSDCVYLDALELADRWGLHHQTLARWRRTNKGPEFVKVEHPTRILYKLSDVEAYESLNPNMAAMLRRVPNVQEE